MEGWKNIVDEVDLDEEVEKQMSQGDLLKEFYSDKTTSSSSEIISIKVPQAKNYNECFNDILVGCLSSNMYDAASGNFIYKSRVNSKYWLDKELIFDKASNGTYLVSIIDEFGKKTAMGYTDASTYDKYMANYAKWNGRSFEKKDGKFITVDTVTYTNGDVEKYYPDGNIIRLNKNGNVIEQNRYNGIGDLRKEEYADKSVSKYGDVDVREKGYDTPKDMYYTYSMNVDGFNAKHYENGDISIINNGVETELTGKYIGSIIFSGCI